MISASHIKEIAKKAGADMCGIAPIERMKNAPPEMNPGLLWPDVKSIVGFVFRIPRGVQRGIEEGTQFYQYPSMAYGGINEILAPATLYHVGKAIEDEGYEAFVYRNTGARGCVSDMDGSVGATLSPEEQIEVNEHAKNSTAHHRSVEFTRATRPGENVPPDLQFQFRICAVACGLGEIGWSKMLLTPQYGPLQRVAFLFTDAEFDEYDEIYHGKPLCRKCGACVRECPALPPVRRVRARVPRPLHPADQGRQEVHRRHRRLRDGVGRHRHVEVLRVLHARGALLQPVRAEGGVGREQGRRARPDGRQGRG